MRIAVVSSEIAIDQGGAWTFTNSLLNELQTYSGGHEFVVWPFAQPATKTIAHRIGRRIAKMLPGAADWATQANAAQLETRAIQEGVDLIWFLNAAEPIARVPYIATVWDLQHRLQPWFPEVRWSGWTWDAREAYYSRVIAGATRVVVGTQEGRRQVSLFYGIDPQAVHVVPFFVPQEREQDLADAIARPAELASLGSRRFFFYPAQFWPHKNHVGLLEAFARFLQQAGKEYALVLVGSDKGNLEYVRKYAERLGIAGSVLFLGFVPRSTLIYCYQHAMALCFPTYFGPDNIPPLEAFSLRCPVIASDVPGSEEQLGDAAVRLPPADSIGWAEAMLMLVRDGKWRNELIERGERRGSSLTASRYVSDVIDIVDQFALVRRCWRQDYSGG